MPVISCKRIRLAADVASLDAPADTLTGLTPAFYRGNDVQVEFALFAKGILQSPGNLSSVTVEIKPMNAETAPTPETAPLMVKTIAAASLNSSLITSDWTAGTAQHGTLSFTAAEANIPAGPAWLSLWVLTTDNPARVITVAAGRINVMEDGASGSVQAPANLAAQTYYTADQSDARYTQRGQNLADLADASAARTNLGLGTAAVKNTGTASGCLPVLNAQGKLDSAVLPSADSAVASRRGGVIMSGGWANLGSGIVLGKSDFDCLFLIKRAAWASEQYILSGATNGFSLRWNASDRLRVAMQGISDILESTVTTTTDVPVWVRLTRQGGSIKLYIDDTQVGSLLDNLNYTGAISRLCALDDTGTSPLKGTLMAAALFNRGLSDGEVADFKALGGAALKDRGASMTNLYNAASLIVGKRVYLKTSGTESITINGQVYNDGTSGGTNATAGLELDVASATITNGLTSASTLRYVGALVDLDCAVGAGYQLHDRTPNKNHALLSETGCEHLIKKRAWQLALTTTAAGYLGSSARAVLPAGHILGRVVAIGTGTINVSLGEASGGATLAAAQNSTSGAVNLTLAALRSSNSRVYANYVSGSGTINWMIEGIVE